MNSKRILIARYEPGLPHAIAIQYQSGMGPAIVEPAREITPPPPDVTLSFDPVKDSKSDLKTPTFALARRKS